VVQVGVAVAVVVAVVAWVGVAAAGVGVAATCSSGRSGAGSALNELLAPGIKPDLVMPLAYTWAASRPPLSGRLIWSPRRKVGDDSNHPDHQSRGRRLDHRRRNSPSVTRRSNPAPSLSRTDRRGAAPVRRGSFLSLQELHDALGEAANVARLEWGAKSWERSAGAQSGCMGRLAAGA
jgi:hypothetical protein